MSAPAPEQAPAPVLALPALTVTDAVVLTVCLRLHDQKCRAKETCPTRDWHAWTGYEKTVRNTLTVLAAAAEAGELR